MKKISKLWGPLAWIAVIVILKMMDEADVEPMLILLFLMASVITIITLTIYFKIKKKVGNKPKKVTPQQTIAPTQTPVSSAPIRPIRRKDVPEVEDINPFIVPAGQPVMVPNVQPTPQLIPQSTVQQVAKKTEWTLEELLEQSKIENEQFEEDEGYDDADFALVSDDDFDSYDEEEEERLRREEEELMDEYLERMEEEDEERRREEEDYWLNGPGNEYYSDVTDQVEEPDYFSDHPDEERYGYLR